MGTSMARRAPRSKSWQAAKATASRFSSPNNTGQVTAAEVVGRYVVAVQDSYGTVKQTARAEIMPQLQHVARNLGRFCQTLARQGRESALKESGLESRPDQPPHELIPALVDALAGPGATLEEAVARSALSTILAERSEDYLSGLRDVSAAAVADKVRQFLAEAVFQKLASDLGESIEAHAGAVAAGGQRLQELRRFFQAQLHLTAGMADGFELSWPDSEWRAWIAGQLEALLARLERSHGR